MRVEITDSLPLVFGTPSMMFFDRFREKRAFVAELRPGLEGMKIVAKELLKRRIEPVIICDNMMAYCMKEGLVRDVHIFYYALNKTMALCRTGSLVATLCAREHGIPVYLYPSMPLWPKAGGLTHIGGKKVTHRSVKTYAPLFEEVALQQIRMSKND